MNDAKQSRCVRLAAAALAGLAFLSAGCTTAAKLAGELPGPIGQSARDQQFREKVESDDFPAASRVGL